MTNEFTNKKATIRTVPQPSDLNLNGHIFGGWILAQMDIAGGVASANVAKGKVATVAIEAMTFHRPIEMGDLISIYTDIERIGRTSVTISMTVTRAPRGRDETDIVTEGRFIYVALDENHKPRPIDPAGEKL